MYKKVICILLLVPSVGSAAWTITEYPSGIQPSSSIGLAGGANVSSPWNMELRYNNSSNDTGDFLCNKAGNTGYMDVNWSANFSADDAPNDAWPINASGNKIWALLKSQGTIEDSKEINCNTP